LLNVTVQVLSPRVKFPETTIEVALANSIRTFPLPLLPLLPKVALVMLTRAVSPGSKPSERSPATSTMVPAAVS
jgi:hypothetical protein